MCVAAAYQRRFGGVAPSAPARPPGPPLPPPQWRRCRLSESRHRLRHRWGRAVAWSGARLPRLCGHDAHATRGRRRHAAVPVRPVRQPVGCPSAGPRGPSSARRRSPHHRRGARGRTGRDRVHERWHRVRQPRRARVRSIVGAASPSARRSSTTPCSIRCWPAAAGSLRSTPAASSTSTISTAALTPDITIVSVMLANNEIGTVQPLHDVVRIVRRARTASALVHTDAVQAFTWLDVAALAADADLISISAHKFGGPKGAACSWSAAARARRPPARRRSGARPAQRHPERGGSVAMATAAQLTVEQRADLVRSVGAQRDRLVDGLMRSVPGIHLTASDAPKTAGICHVCIEGIESEALLFVLEKKGLFASAASSCSSGAQQASHVLDAIGRRPDARRRLVAPVARLRDHRRRRRSRARGDPARGRAPAAFSSASGDARERARRHVGWRRLVGGGRARWRRRVTTSSV